MGLSDEALGFVLVAAAGLSTTIGAALVLIPQLAHVANTRFLAAALAGSAGVMIYVSTIEIFYKARTAFEESDKVGGDRDSGAAYIYATLCFFAGILFSALLDKLVHCLDHGHSHHLDAKDRARLASAADIEGGEDTGAGALPQHVRAAAAAGDLEMVSIHVDNTTADAAGADPSVSSADTADDADVAAPAAAAEAGAPDAAHTDAGADSGAGAGAGGGDAPTAIAAVDTPKSESAAAPSMDKVTSRADLLPHSPASLNAGLTQMGVMTALALAIHNFPEGLATYVATVDDPSVGAALAVAIAVHNIPEGVCVAVPIFFATKSRTKGFLYALASGVSEPVGALVGWAILGDDADQLVYGIMFGVVAGIMVHICVHELIPTALKYDPHNRIVTKGIVAGFAIMAASLVLFVA